MSGTERLGETLRDIHTEAALTMLAVVGLDGLIIEEVSASDFDSESIAAVAASGLIMMEGLSLELNEGAAKITTIEYDNYVVTMAPVQDEFLLVMVSEPGVMNLGRTRIVLRRAINAVRDDLEDV